jgi:hypothetical protein
MLHNHKVTFKARPLSGAIVNCWNSIHGLFTSAHLLRPVNNGE